MVVPAPMAWFCPPWCAEIEDFDAFLAAITREMAWQSADFAEELAGDDRPGEGYLGKAGQLTAARRQAEEIIMHEHEPLTLGNEEDGQEDGESASAACQHRDRPTGIYEAALDGKTPPPARISRRSSSLARTVSIRAVVAKLTSSKVTRTCMNGTAARR